MTDFYFFFKSGYSFSHKHSLSFLVLCLKSHQSISSTDSIKLWIKTFSENGIMQHWKAWRATVCRRTLVLHLPALYNSDGSCLFSVPSTNPRSLLWIVHGWRCFGEGKVGKGREEKKKKKIINTGREKRKLTPAEALLTVNPSGSTAYLIFATRDW